MAANDPFRTFWLRSSSDIWEGGMPGYLIWLNARLYEMKRLLKKTTTACNFFVTIPVCIRVRVHYTNTR